ncbi:MAG TPA: VWA domain-containing protein [Thermoanaerobaculia bacterium]|nr:VWA domain-containing protein [Thermoanaerobaculia bacterium]
MDALAGLSFARPWTLWLLGLLPAVLAGLWLRERARRNRANRFVSERLRGVANPARILRPWLATLAVAFAVIAAAGPRYGWEERTLPSVHSNLIILLDSSSSMEARDVGTSRLTAAKAAISRVLAAAQGRVALVVFEGSAEVVSPLTEDASAVATLVESIGSGEMSEPGSNLELALREAVDLARRGGKGMATMLIVSDGEHRGDPLDELLREIAEQKISVSTVLVGGEMGTTIPTGDGLLRDTGGNLVQTAAHPEILQRIAQTTGGRYFANPFSERKIGELVDAVRRAETTAEGESQSRVPIDRYQTPLALAFAGFLFASILHRGAE